MATETMAKKELLPVLIIPGFMSSGLEIQESSLKKSWEGERIWLNLKSLGFQTLSSNRSEIQLVEKEETEEENNERKVKFSEEEQFEKQVECVNDWLTHMCLVGMRRERDGVKVRPISGLEGVDYLTPGALTNHVSYVFGPVINALKAAGYTNDNLDAAPYDWRLAPSTLESRDFYFSKTMSKVKHLYKINGGKPVVLVCHSLGCKAGHYFLNFVNARPGGREWLDKYIHTFMIVGPPSIGAPKSLRASMVPEKMGLDAFLTDEEAIAWGRSMGSCPWLIPAQLPQYNAPPNAYVRHEALLTVSILPTNFYPLFTARKKLPSLKLAVTYGGKTLVTNFKKLIMGENEARLEFSEKFIFSTPPSAKELGKLRISLWEKGLNIDKSIKKRGRSSGCGCKYVFCCPCMLLYGLVKTFVYIPTRTILNTTSEAMGSSSTIAYSEKMSLSELMANASGTDKKKMNFNMRLGHARDQKCCAKKSPEERFVDVPVKVEWSVIPQDTTPDPDGVSPIAIPSSTGPTLSPYKRWKKKTKYSSVSGRSLFKREVLPEMIKFTDECYGKEDPLGPTSLSAVDAPPVKRVKAIYGINLPTEVATVYRRKPGIVLEDVNKVLALHEVDTQARLQKSQYTMQNGIILETKDTPQVLISSPNERKGVRTVNRSGDGTVPYWSLQHCRNWQGACEVSVDELEGAEHREILADPRFHQILLDYVTL